MEQYEVIMKQEDHKTMKELRELLPNKDHHYYLEDKFAKSREQREQLRNYKFRISQKLKNIEKNERNNIEFSVEIGKLVNRIKKIINEINLNKKRKIDRVSQTRYWEVHFAKKINRINECTAVRRAVRKIDKENVKNYNLSQLIKIGQALNSKDGARKKSLVVALKTGKLKSGKLVSEIKAGKISSELKKDYDPVGSILRGLQTIESTIVKLSAEINAVTDLTDEAILKKEIEKENLNNYKDRTYKLIKPSKEIEGKMQKLHHAFLPKTVESWGSN